MMMEMLKNDGEELKIRRTKKLSIVGICISIAIVVVSLIYEFVYKGEEGLAGVIIGMVGILICVQFYLTSEIGERIGEVREEMKEMRRDIRGEIREARDAILENLQ